MEGKHYRLTGTGLEEMIESGELPIGMKIYAFGAGMSDSTYCVTSTRNDRGQQEVCLVENYYDGSYFGPIHTVDRFTQPISKKFGIGFYWDDKDNFVFPPDAIERIKEKALRETEEIKRKEQEKADADRKEIESLPKQYPYLKQHPKWYMELRANIVADLKHNFTDTKFSIRKRGYDCIYICWTDGATEEEVSKIQYRWEDHKTDYTGDYRDYSPSNFNIVFGGINYIFLEREMSPEIEKLRDDLKEMREWEERDLYQAFRTMFYKTSIPKNVTNLRVERTDITCGQFHDFYRIAFDVPENVVAEQIEIDGIEVIDYSEKAIAVIGDTKPIKDHLKELGGRFNFKLSCGAGWIFPKTKREEVELLIKKNEL